MSTLRQRGSPSAMALLALTALAFALTLLSAPARAQAQDLYWSQLTGEITLRDGDWATVTGPNNTNTTIALGLITGSSRIYWRPTFSDEGTFTVEDRYIPFDPRPNTPASKEPQNGRTFYLTANGTRFAVVLNTTNGAPVKIRFAPGYSAKVRAADAYTVLVGGHERLRYYFEAGQTTMVSTSSNLGAGVGLSFDMTTKKVTATGANVTVVLNRTSQTSVSYLVKQNRVDIAFVEFGGWIDDGEMFPVADVWPMNGRLLVRANATR